MIVPFQQATLIKIAKPNIRSSRHCNYYYCQIVKFGISTFEESFINDHQALNTSQSNMLVLQESCVDSSGSLVVYSPVDLPSINIAMSGEDPSFIPLLPSGFTISPDGRTGMLQQQKVDEGASSSSATTTSGSLLTIVIQIMDSNMTSSSTKMSQESVNTVNNLLGNTVQQIKVALNCSTS